MKAIRVRPRLPLSGALLCSLLSLCAGRQRALGAEGSAPRDFDAVPVFPAPGAREVCPDAVLRLDFPNAPKPAGAGQLQVVDQASGRVAATVDLGFPTVERTVGGLGGFQVKPALVDGGQVEVSLPAGALAYGHAYTVRMPGGAFLCGNARSRPLGGPGDATWAFSTRAAPPPVDASRLVVDGQGKGDFCTIQGALDFIPRGNLAPRTVLIHRGLYHELVHLDARSNVTILGEDRAGTVLSYTNNARLNRLGKPYRRGVFLATESEGLVLANMTIRNTTPQGGSQAEAVIVNGSLAARTVLAGLDLYSYQDTLQVNGQAWITRCRIDGDVDFLWGTGPSFFEACTFNALRSAAYYTQVRNPASNHGFVFRGCRFDGTRGVMGNYLARIDPGRFPSSEVVLVDCVLTHSVGPEGWILNLSQSAPNVHFWEAGSVDALGRPVDDAFRHAASRRLTAPADASLLQTYQSPAAVLGGGWTPVLAAEVAGAIGSGVRSPEKGGQAGPVIRTGPVEQIALEGTAAVFSVEASGLGTLRYQWFRDARALPGQRGPALRLGPVGFADNGAYSVEVSDDSGRAVSASGLLTVVAPASAKEWRPALPVLRDAVFRVTDFGGAGDGRSDNAPAFSRAVTAAAAGGGGIVELPAAPEPYLSSPFALASGIDLQIDAGAVLEALPYGGQGPSRAAGTYPLAGKAYADLVTVSGAHDVAITGGGTVEGQGAPWWADYHGHGEGRLPHRPFLVRVLNSRRVLVSGVTFQNAPMYHLSLNADDLTVVGVVVRARPVSPNTDGIDASGRRILIQNCSVSDGDDDIALKPKGAPCGDVTVADCEILSGHGLSVGGQITEGLDGMIVRNCSFDGTVTGLRLKADANAGGHLRDVTYANMAMSRVTYPIVFYSYYTKVGNPGSTGGDRETTPDKVRLWNAHPPHEYGPDFKPASWHSIAVNGLTAERPAGGSIIWGGPVSGSLFDTVVLENVRQSGGAGLAIYDATNVQLTGGSEMGAVSACNALAVVGQPSSVGVRLGSVARFSVRVAGGSGEGGSLPEVRWQFGGVPLEDGPRPDGSIVAGSSTGTLVISRVSPAEQGVYAAVARCRLDRFDPLTHLLVPCGLPVQVTSQAARLWLADREHRD